MANKAQMNTGRLLSKFERQLMRQLIDKADLDQLRAINLYSLHVQEMDDGGMGSLYIVNPNKDRLLRKYGHFVSEVQFNDLDGILVIAALIVDDEGEPFELDSWKVNFQPLKMGK